MLRISAIALLLVVAASSAAQTDTTDAGILVGVTMPKLLKAKHEFNENNMRGALILYREVLNVEPANDDALYWTARCHYELRSYDLAEEYLGKALTVNPKVADDADFHYGRINHRLARLDKAIRYFERYLETVPARSYEAELTRTYIDQCNFAKEQMEHPVLVEITNMGRAINSRFDDYTPSITAKGDLMLFTSRRSGREDSQIDEGGDYKFFEDIYYSEWLEDKQRWSSAYPADGEINTPTYDAVLSVTPDGRRMYLYKNNRGSAGDIFVSGYDKYDQEWRTPERLDRPINTSYFEGSVSVTADGEKLYFVSERPGGEGQGDIYMAERKGEGWGNPQNLGKVINTIDDEKFVFIHPNGKTLYFASNGHAGMGSYDIYKTEFVNGQWGLPINLGYPINTVNEESTFSLTSDNQTMFIAAEYEDTYGERDIYQINVSDYSLISSGYDSNGFATLECKVTLADGSSASRVTLEILPSYGERILATEKTDKNGVVRVSLPGNATYRVRVQAKEGPVEESVRLDLKSTGETLEKITIGI